MTHECVVCSKPAGRQCGACKMQHYCSSQCQRQNWSDHKPVCTRLANASARLSMPFGPGSSGESLAREQMALLDHLKAHYDSTPAAPPRLLKHLRSRLLRNSKLMNTLTVEFPPHVDVAEILVACDPVRALDRCL